MQQKRELGTRLTYFSYKNEKKISLNLIFVFKPLLFRHTCPALVLYYQKLIQYAVGVSCQSQDPRVPLPGSWVSGFHVPRSQVPRPRVPVPESQGPKSQGPRVSGPVSQVSGPDFRLCLQIAQSVERKGIKDLYFLCYSLFVRFLTYFNYRVFNLDSVLQKSEVEKIQRDSNSSPLGRQ